MSIATIYCAGTAYDDASGDVIAWLNANTEGTRGVDLFFYRGPGSDAMARGVDSIILGGATLMQYADQATGYSIADTVARALADLKALSTLPSQINMAGWSRGAITCLAIAHAMSADPKLSAIGLNLYLFDPVPGRFNRWNWKAEFTTATPNVTDLEVLLMENVSSWITKFAVVDPFLNATQSATNACGQVSLIPMPGVHSSAVEAGGLYVEASKIGAHLVSQFLIDHGSVVSRDQLMRPVELVEAYARLLRKAKYGFIGERTDRTSEVPNAQRDSLFFVNTHHRDVFNEVFPQLGRILQPHLNIRGWSPGAALQVQNLKALAPTMAQVVGDGASALLTMPWASSGAQERDDLTNLLAVLDYRGPIAASIAPPPRTTQSMPVLTRPGAKSTTGVMPAPKGITGAVPTQARPTGVVPTQKGATGINPTLKR